jgi:hypothetical protein
MKTNSPTRLLLLALVLFVQLSFTHNSYAQFTARNEIKIPDIPGYVTLKCDFHMHTVFSDGGVWPNIRPEEAWREGLDAFAITDHIEHTPHEQDIRENHNRPYEIAFPRARELDLKIIKGAEITRDMPPGHFNALFLQEVNALDTEKWEDAIKAAIDQKAFLFWNHPGWKGQQPDGISIWYPEHTELLEKGWLHGIEIVNDGEYYPLAHKWALEKKLTMLGNSDVHGPVSMRYDLPNGHHRIITLVFAKEKSVEAIKDALFNRQTAVYFENKLIGEEKYLKPLFNRSIEIINPDVTITGKGRANIQIHNNSQIDFELIASGTSDEISFPSKIILYADKTVLLKISAKSETLTGTKKIHLPYKVENLLVAPQQGLSIELPININFIPSGPE